MRIPGPFRQWSRRPEFVRRCDLLSNEFGRASREQVFYLVAGKSGDRCGGIGHSGTQNRAELAVVRFGREVHESGLIRTDRYFLHIELAGYDRSMGCDGTRNVQVPCQDREPGVSRESGWRTLWPSLFRRFRPSRTTSRTWAIAVSSSRSMSVSSAMGKSL